MIEGEQQREARSSRRARVVGLALKILAFHEALAALSVLSIGILGIRSYVIHTGRDTYFLVLVLAVTLIGLATCWAAWALLQRRYWYQLLLLLLPLVPVLLVWTD